MQSALFVTRLSMRPTVLRHSDDRPIYDCVCTFY